MFVIFFTNKKPIITFFQTNRKVTKINKVLKTCTKKQFQNYTKIYV